MTWDSFYQRGVPVSGDGKFIGHITPIDHGHPRSDRPRLTRSDRKRIHQRRNRRRGRKGRGPRAKGQIFNHQGTEKKAMKRWKLGYRYKVRSIDLKMIQLWGTIETANMHPTMIVKRAIQKLIRIYRKWPSHCLGNYGTLADLRRDLKFIPTGRNPPNTKAFLHKLFNYQPPELWP